MWDGSELRMIVHYCSCSLLDQIPYDDRLVESFRNYSSFHEDLTILLPPSIFDMLISGMPNYSITRERWSLTCLPLQVTGKVDKVKEFRTEQHCGDVTEFAKMK